MKILRYFLMFWTLFIGIGALWGTTMMFIDPSGEMWGMDELLYGMQVLPYSEIFLQDFILPGIALFLVNGLFQIITSVLLFSKNKYASICGMCCGIILMLWICLQFYIWNFNPLSNAYFVFGLLEAINGFVLYRLERKKAAQKTIENLQA